MGKDEQFTKRDFNAVGTRPVRPDGIDKVTGRARYGADSVSYTHLTLPTICSV